MNKERLMEKVADLEVSQSVGEFRNWCEDNDIKIYSDIHSAACIIIAESLYKLLNVYKMKINLRGIQK